MNTATGMYETFASRRACHAIVLTLVLTIGSVMAQEKPQRKDADYTVKIAGDTLQLTVNENSGIGLIDLIKLTEQATGMVFIYSQEALAAKRAHMLGTVRLVRGQMFTFLQSVLYFQDLACVIRNDAGKLVQIVSHRSGAGDVASSAMFVPPDELERFKQQTGVKVFTSIRLEHESAERATASLNQLLGTQGSHGLQFGQTGNSHTIVVRGFGPKVYQARKLLQLIDVPLLSDRSMTEIVPLQHAAAAELKQVLERLYQGSGADGASSQGSLQGERPVPLHIMFQESSNVLVLRGTRRQLTAAKDLIAQLDQQIEPDASGTRVIRLENVPAVELAQKLKEFIKAEETEERQAAGSSVGRSPRNTVVQAHKETNKVVISARPAKLANLLRMIAVLDQRQRQVLVECAVIELSTSDLARFGIELGMLDIKDDGGFTRPFGFSHFGQSTYRDTNANGLPDLRLPDFANPLAGITGGIITGGDFSIPVLLNALAQDTSANVLSLPSVVVNDQQSAKVESREERPTLEVSQNNVSTVQSVGEFEGAGIVMQITPSISSSNYLRLDVELEASRFLTSYDPNSDSPGVRAKRVITTQVTLPSGHTMVIGGVLEDQVSESVSGVPFLKDIPVLGWLFRSQSKNQRKTNLYFFLTPHILDEQDFSDLAMISSRKKLEAESYIGRRRVELIDPKWNSGRRKNTTLDAADSGVEDIEKSLGFEFPSYRRPTKG